ncbi:hypothetical protein ACIXTV_22720, partial [Bacteroides fragilis]
MKEVQLFNEDIDRLVIIRLTSFASKASAICDPKKPVAPVNNIFISINNLLSGQHKHHIPLLPGISY